MDLSCANKLSSCEESSDVNFELFDVKKELLNFALKLSRNCYQNTKVDENVLFAPSNIYSTLSTLTIGSHGSTRDELAATLGIPKYNVLRAFNEINEVMRRLKVNVLSSWIPGFTGRYVHITVSFSEIMFANKDTVLNATFNEIQSKVNGYSRTQNVDFSNKTSAVELIKSEVMGDGHVFPSGTIPELNSLVSPSAQALLINYYDCIIQWADAFPKNQTRVEKFDLGSEQIDVQMMHAKGNVQFYQNSNLKFTAIGIPIIGGTYYVTYIILPDSGQTISNLIQQLNAEVLRDMVKNSTTLEKEYKIPRLNLKSSQFINEVLEDSLSSVFKIADLSNMITNHKPFKILLNHATEFSTYEDGSRMKGTTTAGVYEEIPEPLSNTSSFSKSTFTVNKPFLFYVICPSPSYPLIAFNAIIQNPAK